MPLTSRTFLITGVTGFLGKVLLEDLVRRREELGVAHVFALIRPKRGLGAEERFRREVVASACFRELPEDWTRHVSVLEGNVEQSEFGLRADDVSRLAAVTHVVHAAASVQFDLPLAEAARANVTATLNALELARSLPRLTRFVYVSTAYVTPARDDEPIVEKLAPLPKSAQELYESCRAPATSQEGLLQEAGLPNSYALTKAIAEHLLVERRGDVPVSIVRPSIITASRAYPFPAWIDSAAGFGAFVMLTGMGHLRALVCDPDAKLDLIPVDEVARRVVFAALHDSGGTVIRHAVVGARQAPTVAQCWDATQRYFDIHRVDQRPGGRYLGPRGVGFSIADLAQHRMPVAMAALDSRARRRQAQKRRARTSYLNREFAYFTTRTFHFQSSLPMDDAYDGARFIDVVDRGVYRHLLKRNDSEWVLAGRSAGADVSGLRWALARPMGNAFVRMAAWLSSALFRRAMGSVTVDVRSFERALAAKPDGATLVLTPSHRSYLDFVLCSYLAFARPDLLPIPHIAATTDFQRMPLLGRLLKAGHAFYLRRGKGKDPELAGRVAALLDRGHTLAFFIEGARSRSRAFLAPKRGLLRCLQATGRTVALLPIAISYERVPEQAAFDRELAGYPREPMRLGALASWIANAWRGRVDLGHIHIACGAPVLLDRESDVHAVSHEVIDQLRHAMRPEPAPARVVDAANGDDWSASSPVPVLAGAHSAR